MNPHIRRALMLLDQGRNEMAKDELHQAIGQDPDDGYAYSVLSICHVRMKDHKNCVSIAEKGIGLSPAESFSYYAASIAHASVNRFKPAEDMIRKAISIDMNDPDYFAQLSAIKVYQREWQESVDAASQGLALDPENVDCINYRSIALRQMGRREEAAAGISSALRKDPEDASAQASMGWNLIEEGNMEGAMKHFREALRLEPESEWARAGIVEAMKGKYFVYRMILNWFLWMGKLKQTAQTQILFGGWLGYMILSRVAKNNPALSWVLMPLIVAYIGFVVMTWLSVPLFNLMLQFNKFGRLVLSDQEKRSSMWVGFALLGAIISVGAYLVFGGGTFINLALCCGLMTPLLGTFYSSDEGWPRAIHRVLLAAQLFLTSVTAVCAVGEALNSSLPLGNGFRILGNITYLPFILLALVSVIGVNFLVAASPRKGTDKAKTVYVVGGIFLALLVAYIGLLGLGILSDPPVEKAPLLGDVVDKLQQQKR